TKIPIFKNYLKTTLKENLKESEDDLDTRLMLLEEYMNNIISNFNSYDNIWSELIMYCKTKQSCNICMEISDIFSSIKKYTEKEMLKLKEKKENITDSIILINLMLLRTHLFLLCINNNVEYLDILENIIFYEKYENLGFTC
ncbi:MAG: hypothetical protein KJ906_03430, partial [Nanoarchaeota archaeon]|nr:hypothetical protein [Nanoarchaeota archaeon]